MRWAAIRQPLSGKLIWTELTDISVFIATDIILPEEKAREKCLISGLILKIPSKTLRSRDVLTRENVLRLYEKCFKRIEIQTLNRVSGRKRKWTLSINQLKLI